MDIIKELPGVVAVVISVLGVYLQYRKARLDEAKGKIDERKSDAEAGQVLQETALALIKPYREELERLNGEVAKSLARIKNLEGDVVNLRNKLDLVIQERNAIWNGAKVLHFQVKNIGAEPVYTPPESVVELTGVFRANGEVGQGEVDKLLGK
jgi:predicted nuclease with TOPRIM domain